MTAINWTDRAKEFFAEQKNQINPSEGFYKVTPDVAGFWLSSCNYQHQRKIRSSHVASLANEMVKGRFRQKTQVNFCLLDGEFYLTNGQHTLSAIVKASTPQELCVVVLEVNNEEEIADDFARHDTHLTRKIGDSLVAHQIHERLGCTISELSIIAAACVYYAFMQKEILSSSSTITHDAKLDIVNRYGLLGASALSVLHGHGNKHYLTRKTTLASIMLTMDADAISAYEFWRGIADDDGLKKGDPRKTLLEFFKESVTTGGMWSSKRRSVKTVPDHMFVKSIALAWNAFVARRELTILRPKNEGSEVKFDLIGTVRV